MIKFVLNRGLSRPLFYSRVPAMEHLPYPDDYPTHKPYTEEEKRTNDQLFEIPYFGQKTDIQKHPSVKGGDIDKNTSIR